MSAASRSRPPTILLVDGDRRTSGRLAQMLREDGFDVETLYDGANAVTRLQRSPCPQVVITELNLAAGSGARVARAAIAASTRTRVIVLTRHPNLVPLAELDPERLLVLTKPLDYNQLLALLSAREARSSSPPILAYSGGDSR